MRGLPKINASYWLTLGAASVFGTNTGDLVSDTFHIGHLNGLPYLAVALAMVFLAERLSTWANPLFFWLVIILVRTAATNVGDAFHDFHIGFNLSLPIAAVPTPSSVRARKAMRAMSASRRFTGCAWYWPVSLAPSAAILYRSASASCHPAPPL